MPSGARIDLASVDKLLGGLEGLLDLESDKFGEDLVDVVAASIRARTLDDQREVDGGELAENRGSYGRAKRAKGIPVGVGPREGDSRMLDLAEIRGDVKVTPGGATMSPGTTKLGRDKARWFEEGRGEIQPERPFYGIDDAAEEEILDRVGKQAEDRLRKLAGP